MSKKSIQQMLDEQKQLSEIHKLSERQVNNRIASCEKWKDPEYREKMTNVQTSTKYKKVIGSTTKQRWDDGQYRERLSESHKNAWENDTDRKQQVTEQFSKPKTSSHKQKISEATKMFNKTEEGKRVLKEKADAQRGIPRRIVMCPHCGKKGGEGIMKRWHFDNCKLK